MCWKCDRQGGNRHGNRYAYTPRAFGPICRDRDRFRKRCDEMNYHLMGPSDMDLLKKQYALADIQKIFMLPDDNSSKTGEPAISNDEIAQLAACDSDFLSGLRRRIREIRMGRMNSDVHLKSWD